MCKYRFRASVAVYLTTTALVANSFGQVSYSGFVDYQVAEAPPGPHLEVDSPGFPPGGYVFGMLRSLQEYLPVHSMSFPERPTEDGFCGSDGLPSPFSIDWGQEMVLYTLWELQPEIGCGYIDVDYEPIFPHFPPISGGLGELSVRSEALAIEGRRGYPLSVTIVPIADTVEVQLSYSFNDPMHVGTLRVPETPTLVNALISVLAGCGYGVKRWLAVA